MEKEEWYLLSYSLSGATGGAGIGMILCGFPEGLIGAIPGLAMGLVGGTGLCRLTDRLVEKERKKKEEERIRRFSGGGTLGRGQ